MSEDGAGQHPVGRGRSLVLPAVFGAIVALFGAVWFVLQAASHTTPPAAMIDAAPSAVSPSPTLRVPQSMPTIQSKSCGEIDYGAMFPQPSPGMPSLGPDVCLNSVEEFTYRRYMSIETRSNLETTLMVQVYRVLVSASPSWQPVPSCTPTITLQCQRMAATQAYAIRVRQAFVAAGYRDVSVRVARQDDVAATGTLLYAVGSGQACVVGEVTVTSSSYQYVAGRLPDGTCLSS